MFYLRFFSTANSSRLAPNGEVFRTKLVVRGNTTISTEMRLKAHVSRNIISSLFLFIFAFHTTHRVLFVYFMRENGENKRKMLIKY